jgi:hypothetical protein
MLLSKRKWATLFTCNVRYTLDAVTAKINSGGSTYDMISLMLRCVACNIHSLVHGNEVIMTIWIIYTHILFAAAVALLICIQI